MRIQLNPSLIGLQAWFSLRSFGLQILQILQRRMIGIALVALLLVSPTTLAGYYQSWLQPGWTSRAIALGLPLVLGAVLVGFSYFGKSRHRTEELLLSLPISAFSRRAFHFVEAAVIQLPVLLLPFLAALNESWFHRPLPSLSICFRLSVGMAGVMSLNGWVLSFVKKLRAVPRLKAPEKAVQNPIFTALNRSPKLAIGILKVKFLGRLHSRKVLLSSSSVFLLSAIGWTVARVPNPEQPKAQVYLLLSGLSVLSCSWLLEGLRNQDHGIQSFLNSLPRSQLWHERSNQLTLGFLLVPLLIQSLLWNVLSTSWSQGGIGLLLVSGITFIILVSQKYLASWHTVVSLLTLGIFIWIQGLFKGGLP